MCYPNLSAVPIHIGGHSRAAARRAGRLGDGFQPLGVGATARGLATIMCDEATHSGATPTRWSCPSGIWSRRSIGRADKLEAGAARVVLAMPPTADIDEARDILSACAERLSLTP